MSYKELIFNRQPLTPLKRDSSVTKISIVATKTCLADTNNLQQQSQCYGIIREIYFDAPKQFCDYLPNRRKTNVDWKADTDLWQVHLAMLHK